MITVFKFYSDTCAPCKMLSTRMETIKDSDVTIIDVNVADETNKDLVEQCGIRAVPVLIFAKLEKFIRLDGVQPLSKINEVLNELRDL